MFSLETQTCALTLADCEEILKKHCTKNGYTKIVSFAVTPLSDQISGFMGKHLKLSVKYKTTSNIETARFFLKSVTDLDNPVVHYFSGVHNKEIGMYEFIEHYNKEFGHILPIDCAPKLYLNHAESQSMVLEDLSLRGFQMPETKIVDKMHMLVAIKTLAKFHAASFIYEETKSKQLGRTYRLTEEFGEALQESVFSRNHINGYKYTMAAIKGVCALAEKLEPDNNISIEEFKRQILLATEKLFDLMGDTKTYRCVWNHGDLWARNMLYRYNEDLTPSECQFVDYQLTRYCPPALDLTMLIYHSVDDLTFKTDYDNLLEYYYTCLQDFLKPTELDLDQIMPRDVYLKSCKAYLHCAKTIKVVYRPMSASNDDAYKNLCKDMVKFERVTFEDRTEYVLENFENDLGYRGHMIEIMGVFREMILGYMNQDKE